MLKNCCQLIPFKISTSQGSAPILFLTFLLLAVIAPAQGVVDLYKLLPEKVTPGSRHTSKIMISNYKSDQQVEIPYWFDIVDEKNGFLSIGGRIPGIWEMRYWNLGQNKKLIAVYSHYCEPVCYVNEFRFFRYENGMLREVDKSQIIQGYENMYDDFFMKDPKGSKSALKEKGITATLLFKLPQKGKDIIAFFGNEGTDETYAEVSKGNRMLLRWHNGTFVKNKIYWDNLDLEYYFASQSASR